MTTLYKDQATDFSVDLFSHLETVCYCNFDNQDILYFFARGVRFDENAFPCEKNFLDFFFHYSCNDYSVISFFFHDVQIVEMHSKGNNQTYAPI